MRASAAHSWSASPPMTSCRMVRAGSRSSPWPSMPTRRPALCVTTPASGWSVPPIRRRSVDLPPPFCPTTPIRSPAATPSETSASTGSPVYDRETASRLTRLRGGAAMRALSSAIRSEAEARCRLRACPQTSRHSSNSPATSPTPATRSPCTSTAVRPRRSRWSGRQGSHIVVRTGLAVAVGDPVGLVWLMTRRPRVVLVRGRRHRRTASSSSRSAPSPSARPGARAASRRRARSRRPCAWATAPMSPAGCSTSATAAPRCSSPTAASVPASSCTSIFSSAGEAAGRGRLRRHARHGPRRRDPRRPGRRDRHLGLLRLAGVAA